MADNPAALFGFAAEFAGDHPAYNKLDECMRTEFEKLHPGWDSQVR